MKPPSNQTVADAPAPGRDQAAVAEHGGGVREGESGFRIFLIILGIVFVAELVVMRALDTVPRWGDAWEALLDASLLTLIISPFVWWLVVHPLRARATEDKKQAETRIERLNHMYAVLSAVNQAIVRIRETPALFSEACRVLVETGGLAAAWIGTYDAQLDQFRLVASFGSRPGCIDPLQVEINDPEGGGATRNLRAGIRQVFNNVETDAVADPWQSSALSLGYRSSAGFPLTVGEEVRAVLILHSRESGFFNAEEIHLLDEMASDISFAMEMALLGDMKLRLATAIEQAPVSVAITAADGRIEYVNPAFSEMTGYSAEEALGSNPRILKSGQQGPDFYEELWRAIGAGRTWRGEMVNRRKDGVLYTQQMVIAPVREGAGVTRFVAISQDITESKRASERLRLQGAALEAAANAVMITDCSGKIVWVNEAFTRLTGWTQEQCAGRKPAILKSGSHDRAFYAELWRTILSGEVWQREMVNRRRSGELYVEDQTITPVRNDHGEITHFVAIKIDIRERKQAEEALRSSRALYRALFDQSPDGVLLIDAASGGTIDANPAASRQLGYLPEEFAGLRISDYEVVETPAETGRRIQRLLAEGSDSFETLHRTKAGEVRDVHVWVRRLDLDGRPAFHCIFEDITDRKRAEQKLLTSLREKETLLKEVHHRVKNNLQVITSLLRLEASRIDHPGTKGVLKSVQDRIQSMAVLHESMYRSGNFLDIDIGAYLRQLTNALVRSFMPSSSGVEIRFDLASARLNLEQAIPCGLIVNELVSNALKHAFLPNQPGVIWIDLHRVAGHTLRLRVRDDGIGVPADFDTRRARSLGLQLVGDLARQLRGRLETPPGPGTAFEVTFAPVTEEEGALENGGSREREP